MGNEVTLYGSQTAIVEQKRNNYVIKGVMGGKDVTLRRGVDFAVIPRTKAPSLTKAGAETIFQAYGVFQRYEIIHKEISTDPKAPSFTFIVRCDLIKINTVDGKEWVVAQGLGAASTNEKSNGMAGTYDSLNRTVKMAEKRAKVDAAINLAGASSWFTQDMENEKFLASGKEITTALGDDDPLTSAQKQRIFAIARQSGYSQEEAKTKLKAMGYASTGDIKQKEYDDVCKAFTPKE